MSYASIYNLRNLTMSVEELQDHKIYDFNVKTISGQDTGLEKYKGKVVLVVNTASKCGFTPQYDELEILYKKYKDQGLEILGFPCNQFGNQEPGSEEEIGSFCKLNYGVTFPIFSKIDVNGSEAHPLFKYLKAALPGVMGITSIKWNFTKFLIDKNGEPVKRYAPMATPLSFEDEIVKLLKN